MEERGNGLWSLVTGYDQRVANRRVAVSLVLTSREPLPLPRLPLPWALYPGLSVGSSDPRILGSLSGY